MHKKTTNDMNYDEIKARGKPPQIYRLSGRDGPPGSIMIPGVPAWLKSLPDTSEYKKERGEKRSRGKPGGCINAGIHEFRIIKKGKGSNIRGKPPYDRNCDNPPETEYCAFQREKLPGMGEVCSESREIEIVF